MKYSRMWKVVWKHGPKSSFGEHRFQNPCGEQKLRDFRTPYLTKIMSIREYSHLGYFSQFIWIIFVFVNDGVLNRPNVSTHVCSFSLLSRGFWNRAIFARHMVVDNHDLQWIHDAIVVARDVNIWQWQPWYHCGEQKSRTFGPRVKNVWKCR